MRSFLLLIAAVFFSTAGFSQKEVTVVKHLTQEIGPWKCKQQDLMKDILIDNPQIQEQYERALAKRIEKNKNNPNQKAAVHSIPVVFHILHIGEAVGVGSNISDTRIQSAIDGLNRDYRRKSTDGGIAEGVGPDMEIEFCLAGRDPNGAVHSGINRIDASAVTDYADKGITENANGADLKNLSKWPTADYVNVWVVREIEDEGDHTTFNGGTLGYAYLPFNPTANALDGVVCAYFACGNEPGGSDPTLIFKKNRTLTHEMGHHLGLYHPFQDESCTETDCATEGDLVCDTPPTILNSNCSQPACGGTQIVENYMDYTGENCSNMFTQGQKDRMRANLDPGGTRESLTVSSGCDPNRVEADFTADVTTVTIGGTVSFTDQSSGAVAPTSWSWDFGDGNTSSTQNPSNVYNSVGFYSVRLAVDNGVNQDTIIKESYIQVVTPVGFCDTLSNITDQANFTYYGITDNWGYYPGHNELNFPMYAEEYFVSAATSVTSLLIPVRIAEALSTDAKIRYIVWADDASTTGLPGTELASVEVPMANLTANAYNSISFDDPVPVNGKFHVGMEIFYGTPQDTISFFIETKSTPAENTLSAMTGQGWLETTDIFGGQVNAASGILAITSQGLAIADIQTSSTDICPGESIDFDGTGSSDAESYLWIFEGGTPNSSTSLTETVTYASGGEFKAYLYAFRCGSPDIDSVTISVFNTSGLTYDKTSPATCISADGSIEVTNPGTFTYNWLTTPPVAGTTLSNVTAGTYQLEVSNGSCLDTTDVVLDYTKPSASFTLLADDTCQTKNGIISAEVAGGGTYTYLWNNATTPEGDSITTAEMGMNYIIIKDADDCEVLNDSILVSSFGQAPDSIQEVLTNPLCNDLGEIAITIFPSTPTSGDWSTILMKGTDTVKTALPFDNLQNGSYLITIGNGTCSGDFGPFELTGGIAAPNHTMSVLALDSCEKGTGSADVVLDSTGVFTYTWSETVNGTDTITDLDSGMYHVSVADVNGCILVTDSILVGRYGNVVQTLDSTVTHTTCNEENGTAVAIAQPDSVNWDYFLVFNGDTLAPPHDSLAAGNYAYFINDGLCASSVHQFSINASSDIDFAPTVTKDTVKLGLDIAEFFGNITGTDYTITWNFGDGSGTSNLDNPTHEYTALGEFTVTVVLTANDGTCERTFLIDMVVVDPDAIDEIYLTQSSIFPNPGSDEIHIKSNKRVKSIFIMDALGKKTLISHKDGIFTMTNKANGQYIISIEFENGVVKNHKLSVQH